MGRGDKIEERFEKRREREEREQRKAIVSGDDAPVPDAPVEQCARRRQGRPQRSLPLWLREEVQEVLRKRLIARSAIPSYACR